MIDKYILNLKKELLNEMALVDAKKVSKETLYSLKLYSIVKEYYDTYEKRATDKNIKIVRHEGPSHSSSFNELIRSKSFQKGLEDNGIGRDAMAYIGLVIGEIFVLYSGHTKDISFDYANSYTVRTFKDQSLIKELIKFLKININSLGNSEKEKKVKEAFEESKNYFSYSYEPIAKAIENKDSEQLGSIIMSTKGKYIDRTLAALRKAIDGDASKFLFVYKLLIENVPKYGIHERFINEGMIDFILTHGKSLSFQQADELNSLLLKRNNSFFPGQRELLNVFFLNIDAAKQLFFDKYYKNTTISQTILNPVMYKLINSGELESVKKAVLNNKSDLKDFTCIYISSSKENLLKFLRVATKLKKPELYEYRNVIKKQEGRKTIKNIVKFSSSLTDDETKELADMVLEANVTNEDVKKAFNKGYYLSLNKDYHLIALRALQTPNLIKLIKKDDKYSKLLTLDVKKFFDKEKHIDKVKLNPNEISSSESIGTNKKIEIMKNAGINKTEIDKLKPNIAKTKKEKKFGRGIIK